MKYMGSKSRIQNYIIPIMTKNRTPDMIFYDSFCGGQNLIDKVTGKRVASDINEYLIEQLKLIRDNPSSLPKNNKEFTKNDYLDIKNNIHKYDKQLVGYVGFSLSYGAMWFQGWRQDNIGIRDYVSESYRNAQKQSPHLQGVKFICESYDNIPYEKNSIIYLDPPYLDTAGYSTPDFDHSKFWDWVRNMSENGYNIYVSEYNQPDDFDVIWKKPLRNNISPNRSTQIEKLFKYNPTSKEILDKLM